MREALRGPAKKAESGDWNKDDDNKEEEGKLNTEAYDRIFDNPFLLATTNPLSTFSIEVNTASYTNVRRFLLHERRLPPKDAVRIAELINFFRYDYPQPEAEHPVSITTEVAACPWHSQCKLVRIGLKARHIPPQQMPPRNLVFLLDTSGSMNMENRLPLLKKSLTLLVEQLRPQDRVAIIAYAGSAGLVLPSTPASQRNTILSALSRLEAGGSTNGGAGIQLAYRVAQENFIKNGINRVILGTDGDFNVGVTNEGDLIRLIEEKRTTGVFLSILGFGMDNLKDSTMEKLAHHGNGHYAYIDTLEEAFRLFVEQGGALQTVANDVKIQVEFNPACVHAYRLVGYENRLMRHEDFNDDTKDAGDLGSGNTVTALYVVAPPGVRLELPEVDPLKYQQPSKLSDNARSEELLTVKIRYKDPGAEQSKLIVHPVQDGSHPFAEASTDLRFAAAVAEFGMLLRDSKYKGTATYAEALCLAQGALGRDPQKHRAAFLDLVRAAQQLSPPAARD
jgi:Ca-activated chloride channel family protein